MKITIESTEAISRINGLECRLWTGQTERGVSIFCHIPLIGVERSADTSQFDQELQERQPRETPQAIPLRMLV